MLGFSFIGSQREKTLEETVYQIQQGDKQLLDEVINTYKPFIASKVSSVCKRYIDEMDDEFSIGLVAFNEAIQKFDFNKGSSLLSFADILIRRRVIDFIRTQSKHRNVSYLSTDSEDHEHLSSIEADLSLKEYQHQTEASQRREEIKRFSLLLREFGLSFEELVKTSPKHQDARKNAALIALQIVKNNELQNILIATKRLPIKQLESLVNVSRKTIERNRKYIIAISLILIEDFLYLKDYIKGVLEH